MSNFAVLNWKVKIEKWKDIGKVLNQFYSIDFMRVWAYVKDGVKVSAADIQTLVQRAERLERLSNHPNDLGYVDSVTDVPQGWDLITKQINKLNFYL